MKFSVLTLLLVTLVYGAVNFFYLSHNISPTDTQNLAQQTDVESPGTNSLTTDNQFIWQAFQQQRSDVQVRGFGLVSRILPDDLKGSRHQRFILTLPHSSSSNIQTYSPSSNIQTYSPSSNDQTLLVAHNIDLANKVSPLAVGDHIEFYGEYEWNAKGGVLHWTHKDPNHRHVDGWLKHKNQVYQ